VHLLEELVGSQRATIPQVLEARCHATPAKAFVRYQGETWSYAEGWEEISRFAGFLGGPGRVAGFLSHSPTILWSWFGTLAAGGVYVSLNRSHRGPVLADLLKRSGASLLVTEAEAWDLLPPLSETGIDRVLFVDRIPDAAAGAVGETLSWDSVATAPMGGVAARQPGDPALILFTSGTTGRSKAVRLPHNMYCRAAAHLADGFGFRGDDVFHAWLPLSHVGGQLHQTMCAILVGACLALYPTFSKSRFWDEVAESGCTVLGGFSNIIDLLLQEPPRADDLDNTLRVGLAGQLPHELKTEFEARFGVELLDSYGMSEMEPLSVPVAGSAIPAGSCGRPGPDFEVAILGPDDRVLPAGEIGVIAARPRVPDVMMQCYEGDEAATVAAWRNLWFHTQDLGSMDDDGFLFFVDRFKHSIRRGGENISSVEVERSLLRHPEVEGCIAVGVEDPLVGQEVKVVLVRSEGSSLTPEAVVRFACDNMARFMVPRYVEFRRTLPFTDVGKVRRDGLDTVSAATWDAKNPS